MASYAELNVAKFCYHTFNIIHTLLIKTGVW